MKKINNIIIGFFTLIMMISCNDGIDPISEVDPGPDQGAPMIEIITPIDGTVIEALEMQSSIEMSFRVEDDIEIGMITVDFDGVEIGRYNSFVDYRIFAETLTKNDLLFGDHLLTITAIDLEGNQSVATATISKPSYTPLFDNEIFYMPFDADFGEYVSVTEPGVVGEPTLTDEKKIGSNAFKSSPDSYLTFPLNNMLGSSFTGMFWYKVKSNPGNAGILTIGDDASDRNQGFRLFREGSSNSQTIKLNVGTGTGESWNNGGTIEVNNGDWINVAFTVSPTETVVYFNGSPMNNAIPSGSIDWTGCTDLVIGSGGPTFDYWGHESDASPMDELRFFDVALTQEAIQNILNITNPYEPLYEGEIFYMPFDGNYRELLSQSQAGVVGSPTFAGESRVGIDSYEGAANSYLTFPKSNLQLNNGAQELGNEFSASFWYKINADPDRAGVLTLRPPMNGTSHDLTKGFSFFRENVGGMQRFKLNVGHGTDGTWFDGAENADVDPATTEWIHFAFTISPSECVVYINGEVVKQGAFSGVDWTGCNNISIMSGAPNFIEWDHRSDLSFMDDLRFFDRVITQEEIQDML